MADGGRKALVAARPMASASDPAISRRDRSSSSGETTRYRATMAASSITHRWYHIGN